MSTSRRLQNACFASLYLLALSSIVACDSVSVESNSDPADDVSQYSGALHPVSVSRINAARLVSKIFGAKTSLITVGDGLSRSNSVDDESFQIPGLTQILSQLSGSIRISVAPTLAGPGDQENSRARNQTDRTIACEIGSIRVTGAFDDDGSGSFKLEYLYCNTANTIINGEVSLLIRKFDQQYQIPTDFNYSFTALQLSAPDLSLKLDGAIDSLVDIDTNTEQLTIERFLTTNNINNEMTMLSNTVKTLEFQDLLTPSPSIETQFGRLFDSIHGYVDFATAVPLAYVFADSKYPSSGQALVRGGNTTIRVTMMPFQRVKLELDLDGDSSFEITTILHWVAILLGLELIDSDGDAMHDRWEVIHGFDPLDAADALQDADNDGYSNVDEYLGGSNPHLAISVPKFQKS